MKKPLFFILLIIAGIVVSCCIWILRPNSATHSTGDENLAIPASLENLPVTKVRQSGGVTLAQLKSPTMVDGFPCAAGWIHFDRSGHLHAFYLGETSVIQGNHIQKGAWIKLYPEGTLRFCVFPEDTNIQGYVCDGGRGGAEGVSTHFYRSGKLAAFVPPENIVIQGIPCKADPVFGISLYENGSLKEFTLSHDATIGGCALSGGQRVVLDESGHVQSVTTPSIFERAGGWIIQRIF